MPSRKPQERYACKILWAKGSYGKSARVSIPAPVVEELQLKEDEVLEMTVVDGAIVMKKVGGQHDL